MGKRNLKEAKATIHPHLTEKEKEDLYSFDWHPDPRKRKFYAAVLRDVVTNTTITWDGVISVGGHGGWTDELDFHNISHAYDVTPFLQHLKDTYGLLDKETHPIWARWENIMIDKMKKWLTAKDISWTDAGYDIGVDDTDGYIWDANNLPPPDEPPSLGESTIKVDDETGEFYGWKSNEQIDKEYTEKSKLQKGYLQWAVEEIRDQIESDPISKHPYRYGSGDSLPPAWIRISWQNLGLDQDEVDWAWRQILQYFKPTDYLKESVESLTKNKFNHIFKDLHNKTVKFPRSNKPLCTGGVSPTLSDGIAVQIYFPSSNFPYYVELDEKVRSPFYNYLETTYNLSEEEIAEVWNKYRRYICHT